MSISVLFICTTYFARESSNVKHLLNSIFSLQFKILHLRLVEDAMLRPKCRSLMQKSVLWEVMRSLSKKEVRELHKWLHSPAHNQREDVVRLFEYLHKHQNSDNTAAPDKNRVWKAVFPGEPFDDARLRQVMFFLLKAIEAYLVFKNSVEDQAVYLSALSKIYRSRKLDKAYRQVHRQGQEWLQQQPLRNGYYLLHRYFLEWKSTTIACLFRKTRQ